ncbi:MAB_1171c family putative transporter [Spongiactinospora sp. 9N601]|uniref:MAB_1171c family putative transporter n=1 Tax=Spongiactinospora sp. 9N601 TaxID=3375149 RepID=UPI003795B761
MASLIITGIVAANLLQVRRAPDDLPLRAALAGVSCLLLSVLVNIPEIRLVLDGFQLGIAKLFVNLVTILCSYFVLAFFLYSIEGQAAVHRTRRQRLLVLLVCTVLTITWFLAPPDVRGAPADLVNGYNMQARIFVLTALVYMAYTMARALRLVRRYIRAAVSTHVRLGIRLFYSSLHVLIIGAVLKAGTILLQGAGISIDTPLLRILNSGYLIFVQIGISAFAVGLGYPLIASMIVGIPVWIRHRGSYRRLETLWRMLNEEFPELTLSGGSEPQRRRRAGWLRIHRGYYRRVIEIRDRLILLAPYFTRETADRARTNGAAAGLSGSDLGAFVQASLIVHALESKHLGCAGGKHRPVSGRGWT